MMVRVLFVMGVAAARRRLDDGGCADSTCWYVGGNPSRTCAFLSEKPELCSKKDFATRTLGYDACPQACGRCDGEWDSESFYTNGKSKNTCDWVARRPDVRCDKRDDNKVRAWYACPVACGHDSGEHTVETCVEDFYGEIEDSLGCGSDEDGDDA